jgi:DNA-directed RNA polymerase subunit RPC12/RpoP
MPMIGQSDAFEFCPHCGQTGTPVQRGQALICASCGKEVGVAAAAAEPVVVDQADELIRQGVAARCPHCRQLVEQRSGRVSRHFADATVRKLCPGSGQPATSAAAPVRVTPGTKDLSRYMTRESIRVVSCRRGAAPQIEQLTLEYLDKSDRVRVQIEAMRDILGPAFRMRDYPAALARPLLAVWTAADVCVVGKKHERGGYQPMNDAELAAVIADLQQEAGLFFG